MHVDPEREELMPLPRSVARFNRAVTNPVAQRVAGRLPGFALVIHEGRTSGRTYRTPVNVFRRPSGWEFALTYGQGDWVRNVVKAGGGRLVTHGRTHRFTNPILVERASHRRMPLPVRWMLRVAGVDQSLLVDDA
jgi:deazaflavin-dependent oxidoreductase (nitroreductase family)